MPSSCCFNKHCAKELDLMGKDNRWIDGYHGLSQNKRKDLNPEDNHFIFPCAYVVHFTENDSAVEIGKLENFRFHVSDWKPENEQPICYVSWWTAVPPSNWEDIVVNKLPEEIKNKFEKSLGNSPAFNGESAFGPIGFVVSWKNILNEYARNRNLPFSKVDLRIFGTFLYSAEIMYSIIVCSKE